MNDLKFTFRQLLETSAEWQVTSEERAIRALLLRSPLARHSALITFHCL